MKWMIFVLMGAILAALANVSLKHGLSQINSLLPRVPLNFQSLPYLASNLYIWLAVIGLGTGFLCWIVGLSQTKLSNAYPILVGVEYSLLMFLSWLILAEAFAPLKIVGVVLVFAGIIIIAYVS